jgi:DNA helicase HerA-like ATPase
MSDRSTILLGQGASPPPQQQRLDLAYANRHGLVAGATGTGKTITLQVLAEQFSQAGIPVFCADVKGDLAGLSQPGRPNPKLEQRAADTGLTPYTYRGCPVLLWDVFGTDGHPVRATVSEMGPVLLSRMLELNDTQEGVLNIAFRLADDDGLLLLDMKDLRAILTYVGTKAAELATTYGNVTKATIGTIQRRLLVLEQAGATSFFGEPALALADIMTTTPEGRGAIRILAAEKLIRSPRLYATILLWLLSTLYEQLPEAGDLPQPKLVFFFDEAHLLFRDAPKPLLEKVEQVVRLIRSKGVGVYFVTQNPADIPETVLGQLGNRIEHALRAYTPVEQRGLRAAADSFRPNPAFDTAEAIQALGVGEALVSVLDEKGAPTMVQKTLVRPPASRLGPITPAERAAVMAASPVRGLYDQAEDRRSAYELLAARAQATQAQVQPPASGASQAASSRGSGRQTMAEAFAMSLIRTVASTAGRELMRGMMGSLRRR